MKFAILTTAVVFFGAATAAPLARREASIVQRDVEVLGVRFIPRDVGRLPTLQSVQLAKDKRDDVNLALDFEKRDSDKIIPKLINREAAPEPQDIPAEIAVKSENGITTPYVKRQGDIPAEIAVKSENGNIVAYVKRQDVIPAEIAVKSDGNGNIVAYVKRQDDVIPAEVAVKSENGNIVAYVKRQDVIPAEIAVKSDGNGNIVAYVKRQDNVIPAEIAVKSENGNIVAY